MPSRHLLSVNRERDLAGSHGNAIPLNYRIRIRSRQDVVSAPMNRATWSGDDERPLIERQREGAGMSISAPSKLFIFLADDYSTSPLAINRFTS